jgi:Gram-negative porin
VTHVRRSRSLSPAALALMLAPCTVVPAAAQGLPPLEAEIAPNVTLRFSGQLNFGVLSYDDGGETNTNFVDNDNSSSRARLQIIRDGTEWRTEGIVEVEYQPLASNVVSQLDDEPDWDFDKTYIRKFESIFASERYGTFWLGQGSMASDLTAEVDLSGTTVIAYSSIADTAGGQFFRFGDGLLSDTTVGDAFNNFDGLGRKVRVRYDTPAFNGFQLRTSYGQDALNDDDASLYDVAATYAGEFPDFKVAGAVSYSWNDGNGVDRLAGSLSALHASGVSATVAAGAQYADGGGQYGYGKLGYERGYFDFGATAVSVDYYSGSDIAADRSDSTSWGLAVVQDIDAANTELWLTWREYDYDDDARDYQSGQAIFGGMRFRF